MLKIAAFAVFCFLAVEQTYRVYVAGPAAFNPAKFNRVNQLMLTDFIEPASHPDIYFRLRPNLREWFRGAELHTNSQGLADQEYPLEKPAGSKRVAVIGSSWTMASGVSQQDVYHSVLEEMLNEAYPNQKYELINFAVEMYGLGEIVATLRHRTPDWQPDMVLAAITTYTPAIVWESRSEVPPLPEPTHPFLQSYVLRAIDQKLGTGHYPPANKTRTMIATGRLDLYREQILRAIKDIGEIADEREIPAMLIWLSFSTPDYDFEQQIRATADRYDVQYVPAYQWILGDGNAVSRTDHHPNAASHRRIAQGLFEELTNHPITTGVE
ncbi:MAG: SGNH/GDSL hydrolase family protein [Gammaproteobacteria bacterium]|nr:SGNH/GDSL hydrolase family protein [Gammaproteobacteria bacterium]